MAALTAVISLFRSGDRILISSNVYGGTFRVLDKVFSNFGIKYTVSDTTSPESFEKDIVVHSATKYLEDTATSSPDWPS